MGVNDVVPYKQLEIRSRLVVDPFGLVSTNVKRESPWERGFNLELTVHET